MRTRGGFTLIELLVTFAIIGILVALLLPAVQQARETARLVNCKNNLRKIGLALHQYHTMHRVFPPGVLGTSGSKSAGELLHTWQTMILPLMDQKPLYQRYNSNVRFDHPGNADIVRVTVPVYLCPSLDAARTDNRFASAHYVGNAGIRPGQDNGILYPLSRISFRDLLDGSSQTVIVGELDFEVGGWARGQ